MSKPAATAAVAFITLLARLTLLPGVDAQFYQVRGDNPSTCRSTDISAPSLNERDVITDASAGHQPRQPAGLALREHPTIVSGFADVNF